MRLPQNCKSGLCFPCVSPDMSHSYITQLPVSWPPRHYLVIPWCFLSWFVHKTYMVTAVPVFRALLPMLSRNSAVWVHSQIWKVVVLGWPSGLPQSGSSMHLPKKRLRPPLPRWNVKSWTIPQIIGINNPPVLRTDTQETENLDKAIFSWSRGCKRVLTPAKQHAITKWLTVAPPYISMQSYLPLIWDLSRSKVHNLSRLAKRLGGWVKACSLVDSGVVQESGRRRRTL
jgi:hypothetical protein